MAVDWITVDRANAVVGGELELSEDDLELAATDVFDLIGWTPAFGVDLASGSDLHVRQSDVLGRAIAWQAAYRHVSPPLGALTDRAKSSESIGSYSVSYAAGAEAVGRYPSVVRDLLSRSGLLAKGLTGKTSRGGRNLGEDVIIPVIP